MATTTFQVTDPMGSTHTRKSQRRTYTHAVVKLLPPDCKSRHPEAAAARDALPLLPLDHPDKGERYRSYSLRDKAYHAARNAHKCSDACDVKPERWSIMGWCGRLDLAQKLAAKGGTILEATVAHVTQAAATPEEAAKRKASAAKAAQTRTRNRHAREINQQRAEVATGRSPSWMVRRVLEHDLTCGHVRVEDSLRWFGQADCPAGVVPPERRVEAAKAVLLDLSRSADGWDARAAAPEVYMGDRERYMNLAADARQRAADLRAGLWNDGGAVLYPLNLEG